MIRSRTDGDLTACTAALLEVHEQDGYPHNWPEDPVAWLSSSRQRHAWVAVVERDDAPEPPAGRKTSTPVAPTALAGHIAVNVAEGDRALSVSTAAIGLPAERLMVVTRLFVVRRFRREGIGRALVDRAVAHVHSLGLQPVLDVLQVDGPAIALYERAGWTKVGTITFRPPGSVPLPAYIFAGPPLPG